MQRRIRHMRRSDEEAIKEAGLLLDFDEIARKGRMSHEETFIGKWYGIYNTRQPGYYMARVVVPAGILTTSQVRALSTISEKYGMGRSTSDLIVRYQDDVVSAEQGHAEAWLAYKTATLNLALAEGKLVDFDKLEEKDITE